MAPEVTLDLRARQLHQQSGERLQRPCTWPWPPIGREDKCLAFTLGHVHILGLMAHVICQSRRELEPADLAVRFLRPGQQGGFIGREISKDVW